MTQETSTTKASETPARPDYATYRELRRLRRRAAGLPGFEGDPDLLFNPDGTVRLPKLTNTAIGMAEQTHGCLTRQPTRERAEAVMAALSDRGAARGKAMEIRPGKVSESFGVYLVSA